MDMVVMLFDNNVYGLTKNQTSPTSQPGLKTNTHPHGAWLPPLNPAESTLGFSNVSFVAQTVDWNPVHLHSTLQAAYKHRGFSFVRILQRCPQYTPLVFEEAQRDPSRILLLRHDDGIDIDPAVDRMYQNQLVHDPRDQMAAVALARREDVLPVGLLFHDPSRPRYDEMSRQGMEFTAQQKLEALEKELERFAV
jgi:2-oxoglutarate ferredoxin oxidoreductase subunit beta